MNTLIINVNDSHDGCLVLNAIIKEGLKSFTIGKDTGAITVEDHLSVRLMRIYTALTGKTPQHIAFPCVVMYRCDS